MRRPAASRRRRLACAAGLAAAALIPAACGSVPTGAHPAAASPSRLPLDGVVSTGSGSWATLAMGRLGQPLDTFWEAFYRSTPGGRWVLRTPPGVADNGGLAVATSGTRAVIGVRGSQLLRFSPLAVTTDGGRHYSPAVVPAGLADAPSALALAGNRSAALTATQVLASPSRTTGWRAVAYRRLLAGRRAGGACGADRLTAVALDGPAVIVGAACSRPGAVGLFAAGPSGTRAVGPHLPAGDAATPVTVVRLAADRAGVAALLRLGGSKPAYVGAWDPTGRAAWSLSAPLRLGGDLSATSVTARDGFAVLAGGGRRLAAAVVEPGGSWDRLPTPPMGTAAVAVDGPVVDALAAHLSQFRDFRLEGGAWKQVETRHVPIVYGSSG